MRFPIDFIFGWFGYVRIPKELVQLSIMQEDLLKRIIGRSNKAPLREMFDPYIKGQQAITHFLRSGRMLQ